MELTFDLWCVIIKLTFFLGWLPVELILCATAYHIIIVVKKQVESFMKWKMNP